MSRHGADLIVGRPPPRFQSARRSAQTEVLDDGGLDLAETADILRDLARFNRLMMGHRPLLRWLDRVTRAAPPDESVTLLDVGCGYGDLLRAVRRWADKRGRRLRLVGIDLNPQVVEIARSATDTADDIAFEVADAVNFAPPYSIDLIVSSLLTHHLSDTEIVEFLRWMERSARRGWAICDLQRGAIPFHFIGLAGPLLRLHPVVTYDGRVSVTRALTRGEWRQRIAAARVAPAEIGWFMFRFVIGRLK